MRWPRIRNKCLSTKQCFHQHHLCFTTSTRVKNPKGCNVTIMKQQN
uniref:Uncharacterized protein n=1 Tax=Rhizophora mucronata TaxID=61149 RepID=A0A2P2QR36_RHIMU